MEVTLEFEPECAQKILTSVLLRYAYSGCIINPLSLPETIILTSSGWNFSPQTRKPKSSDRTHLRISQIFQSRNPFVHFSSRAVALQKNKKALIFWADELVTIVSTAVFTNRVEISKQSKGHPTGPSRGHPLAQLSPEVFTFPCCQFQ